MENLELVGEVQSLRELLKYKEANLQKLKSVTEKLLTAYIGTLNKGGASLAASRDTNPLIAEAEDALFHPNEEG
jgi:hypothetical protein